MNTGIPDPSGAPGVPDVVLCLPVDHVHWTVSPIWMSTDAGLNFRLLPPTWTCTGRGVEVRQRREEQERQRASTERWWCDQNRDTRVSAEGAPTVGTIGDFPEKNAVAVDLLFGCIVTLSPTGTRQVNQHKPKIEPGKVTVPLLLLSAGELW